MLSFGKNMGILLLSITVILTAATFLTTQNLIESSSTNDVGFVLGHVTVTVLDENGFVKDYRQTDNVIVNSGWNTIVQNSFVNHDFNGNPIAMAGGIPSTSTAFTHMGIGTGSGTLDANNADIATPAIDVSGTNVACPRSLIEVSSAGSSGTGPGVGSTITVNVFAEFDGAECEGSAEINEAGVFNAAGIPGGEMLARNVFTGVTALGALDVLEIDWTFTFSGDPTEGV